MKITKYVKREYLLVAGLILLLQLLSYLPTAINYIAAPADLYYLGDNDYPLDMIGNLEIVRQGYLGNWGRTNTITSWPQEIPWFFKFEYILMGQAARLTHIDPLVIYKISTLAISILMLIFFYWFITGIFRKKSERLLAFLLTLFGSGVYFPVDHWGLSLKSLVVIGENTLVLQRFTRVAPHYLLGNIFSLLSIYFFIKAFEKPRKISALILMMVCVLLTTFIFAPDMFLFLFTLSIFVVIKTIGYLHDKVNIRQVGWLFTVAGLYFISALLPMGYIRFLHSNIAEAEKVIRMGLVPSQYMLVIGLIFPLSILSVLKIRKQRDNLSAVLFCFLVAHFLSVFIVQGLDIFSVKRLFQTPYIIVFSIFATLGIDWIIDTAQKIKPQLARWVKVFILLLIFLFGSAAYQCTLKQSSSCFCVVEPYPYGYPRKEVMEAILWLGDHTIQEDVVLSGFHSGTLIPAFAGNKVYTNWWMRLAQPPQLKSAWDNMADFFAGRMNEEAAKRFTSSNKIRYVFTSNEEKSYNSQESLPSYSFLKSIYQKGSAVIYAINQN